MSEETRTQLSEQLEREQWLPSQVASMKSALRHPGVVWLCIQYFFWSIGNYGFVLWLPSVIQKGACKKHLQSPRPAKRSALRHGDCLHAAGRALFKSQLPPQTLRLAHTEACQSILPRLLSHRCTQLLVGGLIFSSSSAAACAAPFGPFFAIIPEMLSKNVAGEVTALVNSCGALGGFVGIWFVGLLDARTGNSRAGFLLMSISLIIASIIVLCLRGATNDTLATLPVELEAP